MEPTWSTERGAKLRLRWGGRGRGPGFWCSSSSPRAQTCQVLQVSGGQPDRGPVQSRVSQEAKPLELATCAQNPACFRGGPGTYRGHCQGQGLGARVWLGPVWSHPHSGNSTSPCRSAVRGWGHPAILVSAHRGEGEGLEEIRSGPSYLPGLSSQGRAMAERF